LPQAAALVPGSGVGRTTQARPVAYRGVIVGRVASRQLFTHQPLLLARARPAFIVGWDLSPVMTGPGTMM